MTVRNEFARPFRVERLRGGTERLTVAANEAERAKLAARFGLLALDQLEADLELRAGAGGTVKLRGTLRGHATQACIVSLEPVPAPLDATFEMSFSEDADPDDLGDIDIDPDAEDPPEPVENGTIDLGEAVVQQMAVTLDPYPRAEGAVIGDSAGDPEGEEPEHPSPFAGLARRPT